MFRAWVYKGCFCGVGGLRFGFSGSGLWGFCGCHAHPKVVAFLNNSAARIGAVSNCRLYSGWE